MVKSFRYVFKRILIGVGIALVLSYLRGNFLIGVSAKEINSYSGAGVNENISSNSSQKVISFPSGVFANWGTGTLHFDFSISTRVQSTSTSPFLFARSATVTSGNIEYVCNIGTTNINNSTWVAINYSADCPMNMGSTGIQNVFIKFGTLGDGSAVESLYTLWVTGLYTFEQSDSVNVNVNSNQTITNDNNNTQNIINNNNSNTQSIINNNNNNTQQITNSQQETTDAVEDLNDSINDDTGVADNDITDLFGDLETSDTPISDLLTMPLTLINAYISGMSGTCQSISLGRLYGSLLVIPCINLEQKLGSDLWSIIDILFSLFMIFNLSQLFITAFDGLTSLHDDFSWLYGVDGKHVGAPSTRVERNSDLY